MTTQDRADPPSLAIDDYLDAARFERAGDAASQRRLQEAAWAMVEPLPDRAKGTELPVLASTWLRAHGWSVLLLPRDEEEETIDPRIAAAILARGHRRVLGASVDPGRPAPRAVWRFPPDAYRRYLLGHTGGLNLVFPEDRSFALLSDDDDSIAIGGPADFVRDAVGGDVAAARQLFERWPLHPERQGGPPAWYRQMVAHYAPFLLGG